MSGSVHYGPAGGESGIRDRVLEFADVAACDVRLESGYGLLAFAGYYIELGAWGRAASMLLSCRFGAGPCGYLAHNFRRLSRVRIVR